MRFRSVTVAAVVTLTMVVASGTAGAWGGAVRVVTAAATAAPYQPGAGAVTYSPDLVPVGAHLGAFGISTKMNTSVMLSVQGLRPHRDYGAHVHVNACGPNPADAGPHFQDVKDPVQPSVDPKYANPRNEIWLDFSTDLAGNALVFAHVPWGFGTRTAGSVVVHDSHTHTDPGHAGTAGARLACLNVPF
ncbi:superoxide dismutase family protein [Actinocrispum wychmicini]|uniref:Cu-Zn family superoxide dismutase n=1 Tax=Actinocrispum wychmicini TaxID=1213861 RepID=A0A4R2JLV1_9PSEU|nr:superoxide dismutase family protein [Actinocrispum wychmicini]TCO61053.1 Cu-Zn family superoxide dismutase [Actinocrispum wychmicini]